MHTLCCCVSPDQIVSFQCIHLCFFSLPDEPVLHEWLYPGQCSHSVGEWSWVPFRNNCYAFNLQSLRQQQDARSSCKKGTAPPDSSSAARTQLMILISKPIKYNASDLVYWKHN